MFDAGLDGVTFASSGCKLLGGFYRAAGDSPRPTAILLHGLPGIEKNLDIAYSLRELGWNCLYFHFRGSWGSEGAYSLGSLADDTRAAIAWTLRKPSVDASRVVLIGGSAGGHTVLLCAATDPRIRAVVGIAPLIDPRSFDLRVGMANEFADMLSGVSGDALRKQWNDLPPLTDHAAALVSRPVLLVTADKDDLFPPSHYEAFVAAVPSARWVRSPEGDHAFSTCRPWMVRTVTDWLISNVGK